MKFEIYSPYDIKIKPYIENYKAKRPITKVVKLTYYEKNLPLSEVINALKEKFGISRLFTGKVICNHVCAISDNNILVIM